MKKLLLLLLAALVLMACGEGNTDNQAFEMAGLMAFYEQHYAERMQAFHAAPSFANTVYLGDSITELCGGFLGFAGDSVNRGISYSGTHHMFRIVQDTVISEQPRAVQILVGINDRMWGTEGLYAANMIKLIAMLKAGIPGVEIRLIGQTPSLVWEHERARARNRMLENIAALTPGVTFRDVYDSFLIGGAINPLLVSDGTHLTEAGCKIIFPY